MGSTKNNPGSVGQTKPERRCVAVVGYREGQTVTASQRSYCWIARCCRLHITTTGTRTPQLQRGLFFSRGGWRWLVPCSWCLFCARSPSSAYPRWRIGSCHTRGMVLPSPAAAFWATVVLQRCMYTNCCMFVARAQITVISSHGTVGQSHHFFKL